MEALTQRVQPVHLGHVVLQRLHCDLCLGPVAWNGHAAGIPNAAVRLVAIPPDLTGSIHHHNTLTEPATWFMLQWRLLGCIVMKTLNVVKSEPSGQSPL